MELPVAFFARNLPVAAAKTNHYQKNPGRFSHWQKKKIPFLSFCALIIFEPFLLLLLFLAASTYILLLLAIKLPTTQRQKIRLILILTLLACYHNRGKR